MFLVKYSLCHCASDDCAFVKTPDCGVDFELSIAGAGLMAWALGSLPGHLSRFLFALSHAGVTLLFYGPLFLCSIATVPIYDSESCEQEGCSTSGILE